MLVYEHYGIPISSVVTIVSYISVNHKLTKPNLTIRVAKPQPNRTQTYLACPWNIMNSLLNLSLLSILNFQSQDLRRLNFFESSVYEPLGTQFAQYKLLFLSVAEPQTNLTWPNQRLLLSSLPIIIFWVVKTFTDWIYLKQTNLTIRVVRSISHFPGLTIQPPSSESAINTGCLIMARVVDMLRR